MKLLSNPLCYLFRNFRAAEAAQTAYNNRLCKIAALSYLRYELRHFAKPSGRYRQGLNKQYEYISN